MLTEITERHLDHAVTFCALHKADWAVEEKVGPIPSGEAPESTEPPKTLLSVGQALQLLHAH